MKKHRVLVLLLALIILFSDITVFASVDVESIVTSSEAEAVEEYLTKEVNNETTEDPLGNIGDIEDSSEELLLEEVQENVPQTGYFSENDQKYYADSNGVLQSGWIKLGDCWRYFDKEQEFVEVSAETEDGCWYKLTDGRISYFDKKTTLIKSSWKTINDQKYYFDDEGFCVKGWYQDGTYWYYANEEGQMQNGVFTLGAGEEAKNYFFDSEYRLSSGWKKLDGIYRYFNYDENHEKCHEVIFDGTSGWVTDVIAGRKCYIDAKKGAVTGWKNLEGYRYHFDANGFMDTGLFQVGRYHYFAETENTKTEESPLGNVVKGIRKIGDALYGFHPTEYYRLSGWQTLEGCRYYFADDYSAVTGWYQEGKYWYYAEPEAESEELQLIPKGAMAKGEKKIGEHTYYFDGKYHLVTGWVTINGEKRYFETADAPEECYEIESAQEQGWYREGNDWYYVDDNCVRIKGEADIDGKIYYFDSKSHLKTGWIKINNCWRYFETADDPEKCHEIIYILQNGWAALDDGTGRKSYIDQKNVLVKGWLKNKEGKYYFDSAGMLKTGWFTVGSGKYFADENGLVTEQILGLKNTWWENEGQKYYFNSKGQLLKGFQTINKQRFYFDNTGVLQTGWFEVNGKTYYGAPKEQTDGILQGALAKGAKEIDGSTYVFHSSQYYRLKGFQSSGGKRFYLQTNGKARTGWFTVGTDLYYGEPETTEEVLKGTLASGAKEIERNNGSDTYFFHTKSNYRLTGWQTVNKKKYYLKSDGAAKTGWFTVAGKTYYGEPETTEDGILKGTVASGVREINGKTYVFHSSKYYRLTGWQTVNKKKYYLKSDGTARTGWFKVGGKWYYGEPETTEEGILRGTLVKGFKMLINSNGDKPAERTYYFDSNYRLVTGWTTISKIRYFFQKDTEPENCYLICQGPTKKGWFTFEDGRKSYLNSKGKFLTGWQTIEKKKYYFDTAGIMQTGWRTIGGKEYYFNGEGIYIPFKTPSIISVTSTKFETADVKWEVIDGAKSYLLQYSKDSSFSSWSTKTLIFTDTFRTEYCVENLEGNETYYFRLRYTVWSGDEETAEISNSGYSASKKAVIQGEVEPTETSAEISECRIVSGGRNSGITVNLKAALGQRRIKSADENYYVVETESFGREIDLEKPVAEVAKNFDIDVTFEIGAGDGSDDTRQAVAIALMNKFALAIKNEDGSYQLISEPVGLTNPEFVSENKAEIFKPVSKKGIQDVYLNDRRGDGSPDPTDGNAYGSNTKNTLINVLLNDLVGTSEGDGYKAYEYKGKTYYFSDCASLLKEVEYLVEGYPQYIKPGVTATNQVAVTFVLLLAYDNETSYLIDPSARIKGHNFYTLNVREEEARETLEALFLYLGEIFGQNACYVTHWILGNEVNSSKAWNYQGNLSFDNYIKSYASAFRLLYNGVKAGKNGNNVYISLDNGWMAAPDTYSGKSTLDKFAECAQVENEDMLWSIAYHGYSYPLTKNDFWNDSKNTTFSTKTKYISMKNISVLTDYASALEEKYEKPSGSIRVILSEQGYNGKSNPTSQAQALARGYYLAEFNERIDAFIIRAIIDDQDETAGGLHLGIRKLNHEKRIAYFVYEYMDSDLEYMSQLIAEEIVSSGNVEKFKIAQKILCETNWENIIPGFGYEKLAGMH